MRLLRSEAALALLLLVAYGWLFVFFERENNPNELARVQMSRALAFEHKYAIGERHRAGSYFIDTYSSWGYVNDKALVCDDPRARPPECSGQLYSAKAPGASLLGAPVVWLLGRSASKAADVFALRWLLCILPTVALWLAVRRFLLALEVPEAVALACTLAGALGSLSLTYGQMFAGHQLAAVALGAAFLAGFWPGRPRPFALGFGCAAAVCLEYPAAPAAAILAAAWLLRRPSVHALGSAFAGALLPALLLAHFHTAAFGSPLATPYSHLENPDFVRDISPGFMGISAPTPERLYGSLFAPWLGLFYWAPWTAFVLAAPFSLRRGRETGTEVAATGSTTPTATTTAIATTTASAAALAAARLRASRAACAIAAYYLLFQITHALWRSGWVVGPRYITPIVPFAAIAVALALRERPRWLPWFCGAAIAAIGATGLASAVCQGFPLEVINPLREVVWPLLSHGYVPRNLLQLAGVPGLWSALPYFAALLVAIALLLRLSPSRPKALALAAALTLAQWLPPALEGRDAVRYLASIWDPAPPPGAAPF